MKLEFFDCNVQIGRLGSPQPEYPLTGPEIDEKLTPLGIKRALAFNALAKELHPSPGNAALIEMRSAYGPSFSILPCWVAMPHHTGEMPHPSEFVEQMRRDGARAVRLFPNAHQYSLSDWCAGEMLDAFEEHRVPVFVELTQTSYEQIESALRSHPALRLTLVQPSYRCDRFIYPLMERYEHFTIETSNYVVSGGIEAICRRFGASRLLFGTALPFTEPGAPVAMITFAEVSDEEKTMIAGGNLDRLLEWTR
jgi:predicted TIM-barrel fold metal-dependent hydrolase